MTNKLWKKYPDEKPEPDEYCFVQNGKGGLSKDFYTRFSTSSNKFFWNSTDNYAEGKNIKPRLWCYESDLIATISQEPDALKDVREDCPWKCKNDVVSCLCNPTVKTNEVDCKLLIERIESWHRGDWNILGMKDKYLLDASALLEKCKAKLIELGGDK